MQSEKEKRLEALREKLLGKAHTKQEESKRLESVLEKFSKVIELFTKTVDKQSDTIENQKSVIHLPDNLKINWKEGEKYLKPHVEVKNNFTTDKVKIDWGQVPPEFRPVHVDIEAPFARFFSNITSFFKPFLNIFVKYVETPVRMDVKRDINDKIESISYMYKSREQKMTVNRNNRGKITEIIYD